MIWVWFYTPIVRLTEKRQQAFLQAIRLFLAEKLQRDISQIGALWVAAISQGCPIMSVFVDYPEEIDIDSTLPDALGRVAKEWLWTHTRISLPDDAVSLGVVFRPQKETTAYCETVYF